MAACTLTSCASWKPVHATDGWTLYVKDGAPVDVGRFERALEPAFDLVEERKEWLKGVVEDEAKVRQRVVWEHNINCQICMPYAVNCFGWKRKKCTLPDRSG